MNLMFSEIEERKNILPKYIELNSISTNEEREEKIISIFDLL